MSNMGYLSTLLPAEAREKAGPKSGAVSMATVNIDPLGAVSVTADVTVQGQGHQTVLAQIVADELGLEPEQVQVNLELRYRRARVVDRSGHLFVPVLAGHGGRRTSGRA